MLFFVVVFFFVFVVFFCPWPVGLSRAVLLECFLAREDMGLANVADIPLAVLRPPHHRVADMGSRVLQVVKVLISRHNTFTLRHGGQPPSVGCLPLSGRRSLPSTCSYPQPP